MTSSRGEQEAAIDTVTTAAGPRRVHQCESHLRLRSHRGARRARCELPDTALGAHRRHRTIGIGEIHPAASDRRTRRPHRRIGPMARTRGQPARDRDRHGVSGPEPAAQPRRHRERRPPNAIRRAGPRRGDAATHTRHSTSSGSATWPPNCPRSCREASRSGSRSRGCSPPAQP